MSYEWATWMADALRAAGVKVVEEPGWKTRGLGAYRRWEPATVVWHHDASPKGDSPGVVKFILSDIENHGAHVWISRAGVWHLLAAGRVGHTGRVKSGMPDNETAIGIETDHTTGEAWPDALLNSLRLGTAALFADQGWRPDSALFFHKQISTSGKVDPDGLSLTTEKAKVAAIMARLADTTSREDDRMPIVELSRVQRLAQRARWSRGYGKKGRAQVKLVSDALDAEKVGSYRAWQQKLGYSGADADGIPGESSLTKLGKRHGFRVAP